MIAELGQYALILALALGADPVVVADHGRTQGRYGADEARRLDGAGAICLRRAGVRRAHLLLRDLRLLGRQCVREFALADAADLQVHQRLGQPRRLHAAVGADPRHLWRIGGGVRRQSAGEPQGQCAGGAVLDRVRVLPLYSLHLESVPAAGRGAGRGP